MKKSGYRIRSVILCDDVRREANGKEILIGVYNDTIIFSSFPAVLPQFVVRVSLSIKDKDSKVFKLLIKDPNGEELHRVSGNTPVPDVSDMMVLGTVYMGMLFQSEGIYTIWFALGDGAPKQIWDFVVRSPVNATETQKFSI
jgi:hypothetical protein